jgi:hypothetical protein
MSRRLGFFLLFLTALGALPARSEDPCTIDLAPAATLLLPYFEVFPERPQGLSTML